MGFYGNITNTSRTAFQFDRVYPSRMKMEENQWQDGVYVGRYVLIEYDTEVTNKDYRQAYLGTDGKLYSSINCEADTRIRFVEDEAINPKDILYGVSLATLVYVYNESENKYTYYECTGEEEGYAKFEVVEGATNVRPGSVDAYVFNYNNDKKKYGYSRGYDSTVWQKTFVNGVEKYVMIAELNTVVPTFDITADAPSITPLTPHFDEKSTDVYYKLHWQPQWGLRVKANKSDLTGPILDKNGKEISVDDSGPDGNTTTPMSTDRVNYPSDDVTTWSKYEYDTTTAKETKKSYNPTTSSWEATSEPASIGAAIYWNKAGFDPEYITYSADLLDQNNKNYDEEIAASWTDGDRIQLTPTGQSGHTYEKHSGTYGDVDVREDTQELSIMLPSIGNSIAQMWDIVYGGRDTDPEIAATNQRNTDVQWEDGARVNRQGLRAVNIDYTPVEVEDASVFYNSTFYVFDATTGKYNVATAYDPTTTYYKRSSGYTLDTNKLNTLAGCINSVHDLMGMIIVEKGPNVDPDTLIQIDPDINPLTGLQRLDEHGVPMFISTQLNPNDFDKNKIYYFHKDGTYRHKGLKYDFEEIEYNFKPVTIENFGFEVDENNYEPNLYYYYEAGSDEPIKDKNNEYVPGRQYFAKTSNDEVNGDYVVVDPAVISFQTGYYYRTNDGSYIKDDNDSATEGVTYYSLDEDNLPSSSTLNHTYHPGRYFIYDSVTDTYQLDTNSLPRKVQYYNLGDLTNLIKPVPNMNPSNPVYTFNEDKNQFEPATDENNNPITQEYFPYDEETGLWGGGYYYPVGRQITKAELQDNATTQQYYIYDENLEAYRLATQDEYDEKVMYFLYSPISNGHPLVYIYAPNVFYYHPLDDDGVEKNIWSKETNESGPEPGRQYYLLDKYKSYTGFIDDDEENPNNYLPIQAFKVNLISLSPTYYIGDGFNYTRLTNERLQELYEGIGKRVLQKDQNGHDKVENNQYVYENIRTTDISSTIVQVHPEALETFYAPGLYFYRSPANSFIVEYSDEPREDVEYYDIDLVSFVELSTNFYIPNKYYYYDEALHRYSLATSITKDYDVYYNKINFYVRLDEAGIFNQHNVWNRKIEIIPCTVSLDKLKDGIGTPALVPLEGFARTMNTIHGLIVQTNNLLLSGDYATRDRSTVQGVINTLNDTLNRFDDFKARALAVTDAYGRITTAGWTSAQPWQYKNFGNNTTSQLTQPHEGQWISMDLKSDVTEPKLILAHNFTAVTDTETHSNKNTNSAPSDAGLNNGNNDILKLYAPIVDKAGHVVGHNTEHVVLPYGYQFYNSEGITAETADLYTTITPGANGADTSTASTEGFGNSVEAESAHDQMAFNPQNKWIQIGLNNKELLLAHETHAVNHTPQATNLNTDNVASTNAAADNITVQDLVFDLAGHVIENHAHTYTLPYGFKTVKVLNSTDVTNAASTIATNGQSAESTQDILTFSASNKWIKFDNMTADTVKVGHLVAGFTSGTAKTQYGLTADTSITTLDSNNTFTVPTFKFDEAGHITMAEDHTITIPEGFTKVATQTSSTDNVDSLAGNEGTAEADTLTDTFTLAEGNKWINTTIDPTNDKVTISHYVKQFTEQNATSDLNTIDNNIFDIQKLTWDRAGHITGSTKTTYTLPNNFKKIKINNNGVNLTSTSAAVGGTLTAATPIDTAILDSGNRWIALVANEDNNTVSLYHASAGTASTSKGDTSAQTPKFGDTFKVLSVGIDQTGHVGSLDEHNVTIPKCSLTDATSNGADVITKLSLNDTTGAFTTTRTNIGALKLTGYSKGSDSSALAATDTLNAALGKLEQKLTILNGNSSTNGSVAYQIAQVVAGADSSFDTLKEIADWINSDTTGAANMANRISALENTTGELTSDSSALADRVTVLETASATHISNSTEFNYPAVGDIAANQKTLAELVAYISTLEQRIYNLEHPTT